MLSLRYGCGSRYWSRSRLIEEAEIFVRNAHVKHPAHVVIERQIVIFAASIHTVGEAAFHAAARTAPDEFVERLAIARLQGGR